MGHTIIHLSFLTILPFFIVFALARSTESFENDSFIHDPELLLNALGYGQIIINRAMKVVHLAALQAMKVMMGGYVCIEALCTTENFNHIQNPDFRKGQQRAVDRVKGNMRVFFSHDLIHGISGGMGVQAEKMLINCHPLRGYFQAIPLTDPHKFMESILIGFFFHIYPK
jgi:hypothetical protein